MAWGWAGAGMPEVLRDGGNSGGVFVLFATGNGVFVITSSGMLNVAVPRTKTWPASVPIAHSFRSRRTPREMGVDSAVAIIWVLSSFPDQSRICLSRPDVMKRPSRVGTRAVRPLPSAGVAEAICLPQWASQRINLPSCPAVAIRLLSGVQATAGTGPLWPLRTSTSAPVAASLTMTVPDLSELASSRPSGLKRTSRIQSTCFLTV